MYGWVYQGGRDLSGFIDGMYKYRDIPSSGRGHHSLSLTGTENPAEEDDRVKVAVSGKCGGSYVVSVGGRGGRAGAAVGIYYTLL